MPETPQQGRAGRPYYRHRRGQRRARTPRVAPPLQGQNAQVVITPKPTVVPAARQVEPNYSYVFKDLKNIAMIVGGIVVVYLVILFVWK